MTLQTHHSYLRDSTHRSAVFIVSCEPNRWTEGWFYCRFKACYLSLVGVSFCYYWNKPVTLSLQLLDGRGRILFVHTSCSSRERPFAENITVTGSVVIVAFARMVIHNSCTHTSSPFCNRAVPPSIIMACFLPSQGVR